MDNVVGITKAMVDPYPTPREVELLLNFRTHLHTLSADNSSSIATAMTLLQCFDDAERLTATVAMLVDKAIEDPHLAKPCAEICLRLADWQTPISDESDELLRFRSVLLHMTRTYSEKADENCCNSEAQVKLDRENGTLRRRLETAQKRHLASVRFLSQLHVYGLLTHRVIIPLLQKLSHTNENLEDVNERRVECVCIILQTCGPYIKEQKNLEVFYQKLRKLLDAEVISSRVSCMIENTFSARNNGYISRTTAVTATAVRETHAAGQKPKQTVTEPGQLSLSMGQPLLTRGGKNVGIRVSSGSTRAQIFLDANLGSPVPAVQTDGKTGQEPDKFHRTGIVQPKNGPIAGITN
ncbi:eukaryotic translation initiation factor 4 gamma 2-like [Paramacrobiotus metropolitanus]|uniref:eukaryotic translation initiation factor 4 gamma 2-like n=1 Tax=Paramacrobiotus metropolitanus TaxID=2943436 RepID=UPI00244576F9|nr:eukaryotic translation initiation factor 4 gamma 2-like [Paramacrobiotus metropolitanus]